MNKKKKRKYMILFLCFIVALIATGTTVLLARYHSIQAQKGVAVASNMYFSSNYLELSQTDDCVTKYNTDKWDGDRSLFKIKLRNYENKLLYNKGEDLTCDISFQLTVNPTAGFHYIVYDPNGIEEPKELKDSSSIITLNNLVIPGGSANEIEVQLGIVKDPEVITDTIDSDEVLVTATIVSPEYALNLGPLKAKLIATTSNEAFSFTSKFKIADELGETGIDKINKSSGFVYVLDTTGGTEEDEVKLRLSWNKNLLGLNEFDDLYNIDQIKVSSDGIYYYIDFLPKLNAHREFIFYKTSQFDDKVITDNMGFEQLVTIVKIQ